MIATRVTLFALLSGLAAFGCSSSTTPGPAATPDSGTDAAADTGAALVNNCAAFEDHTAAGDARTLTWNLSIAGTAPRCMKIKVGQTVTWNGDFNTHPLTTLGGDTPNPISTADTTTGKVTFATAGTFGYVCGVHASMNGAILVTP